MASRMQHRFCRHRWSALIIALALLAGCSAAPTPARHAVAVRPDDTCAVCGMELSRSPGPRGQAWVAGHARPLLFDSTRDFFAYVLQPENQTGLQDLFVQDAARIDWQHPGRDASTFIDAHRAVYVAWQPLPGSMGPTFAPFADRKVAEGFAQAHGGAVLTFAEITPDLVATLDYHCPAATSPRDMPSDVHCVKPQNGAAPSITAATHAQSAPAQLPPRSH